jgi:hypothetical protein
VFDTLGDQNMTALAAARAFVAALLSSCAAVAAAAQAEPPLLPSSPIAATVPVSLAVHPRDSPAERLRALQHWTRQYEAWKASFVRAHNGGEGGWVSTRQRHQRPDPPVWLPEACAELLEDEGPLADGCRAWHEWRRGELSLLLSEQVAQTRAELESPRKSAWWQHVHLDALWPMTQTGSSAYGVAGVHATVSVMNRFQVFLAPGAILMRLPTSDGKQTWSLGTDWGFSYRMFDFKLPGTQRLSTLHLNIARVWIFGPDAVPLPRELSLAGFSLTFKQHPDTPQQP